MAGEKYKSSYINERGEKVPVTAKIEYKVPGFFRNLRDVRDGETPTDTVIYVYPQVDGGMSQKITRSPGEVTTERMDNSTGEWVPQINERYWDDKSKQVYKNKEKMPSFGERILKFVGFKRQGGDLQYGSDIKEKVRTLIKLRKDPEKGQQALQLLGEFIQNDPTTFKNVLEQLLQEQDPDAIEFYNEMQQKVKQAKKGTKLNYVKELKGICPEGYMKHGGRCKPCEAKMKAQENDPVKSFKAGRKCKK